jgi:hypothetical protein
MDICDLVIPDSQESQLSSIESIPESQLSTQSWDSRNGPRPQSESPVSVESTLPSRPSLLPDSMPTSQDSSQLYDSQNWDTPSELSTSLLALPQTPKKQKAPLTTCSDWIRIKTALDFGISHKEICNKYSYMWETNPICQKLSTYSTNKASRSASKDPKSKAKSPRTMASCFSFPPICLLLLYSWYAAARTRVTRVQRTVDKDSI